jgi:hypothetical protein
MYQKIPSWYESNPLSERILYSSWFRKKSKNQFPKKVKNSSTTLQPFRNYFKSSKDFSTKIRGDSNMVGIGFVVRADILLATISKKKNSKNYLFPKTMSKILVQLYRNYLKFQILSNCSDKSKTCSKTFWQFLKFFFK